MFHGLWFWAVALFLCSVGSARKMTSEARREGDGRKDPPLVPLPGPAPAHVPVLSFFDQPVAFPLGWRPQQRQMPFVFTEAQAAMHQFIAGTTGSGKSRYAELQCRFFIDSFRGFCFLDADGDTAENLFAYALKKCEEEGTDAICHQLIYIELDFRTVFGHDPFRPPDLSHLPGHLREGAYRQWLSVKVDAFITMVQAKQGDASLVGMPLLERGLRAVLTAVGTSVDKQGNHLPLSAVFALLDCEHKNHTQVYGCVRENLPDEIRDEFERWSRADRRTRMQEQLSTLNRLRSILSPLVLAIYTSAAHTIDFRKVIDGRMILLVNLRETDFLSADQQRFIGTMFIHGLYRACRVREREDRAEVPYYLFVDEAHLYMETAWHDLQDILERGRKYKISLTLMGQFLGQFRNERVDMTPAILNLCRSVTCFLHSNPDDLEVWMKYFGYPNLDFTELFQVHDRPDGNEFIKLQEYARNYTTGTNWNVGTSLNKTDTDTSTTSHAVADTAGNAHSASQQTGTHNAASAGTGKSESEDTHRVKTGEVKNANATRSAGSSDVRGATSTVQNSQSVTNATSEGQSHATGMGVNAGQGGNQTQGFTVSEKTAIVPKTREEWHPTGKLRHAVEDQFHRMAQDISTLPDRHAMVRLYGEQRTFLMQVADCPDVYPDPRELARRLKIGKEKIYALHEFYVTPCLSPKAQEERFVTFLARVQEARGEQEALDPAVRQNGHANGTNGHANGHLNGHLNGQQHRNGHQKNSEKTPLE